MTFDEYKEEILNGEKMEWYGTMVPRKLVTNRVSTIANMIVESISKMEGELSDMRKGSKEQIKRQNYVDSIWLNIKHLPYTSNGLINDVYMKIRKQIIEEAEKEGKKTKPKVRKTRKPKVSTTTKPKDDTAKGKGKKTEEPTPVVKGRRGKNNYMTNTKRFIDTSEDSISKYLKDVRKIDMITADEEAEIAKLVAEGDQRATEKLVKSNLRFVISVAKEYQNQGLPLSDLISEGNFGLIKAAKKFDPTRGFRFISYAVWWVKQAIIQSLNDHARTVRLPVNVTNNVSKLKKEMIKFEQEHGRKANSNDKLLDKDGKEFDMAILLHPTCSSLNDKINEDGDEVMDVIADNSFTRPDEDIYTDEVLKAELNDTLSILSDRERKIIEMYFGMDGTSMTLEQIGDEYNLTKERIRQIKEKALRKLKNNCDNLFDFMYK